MTARSSALVMPVSPESESTDMGGNRPPAEGVTYEAVARSTGEVVDVPETEEAQLQKSIRTPSMPTPAEMAEHRANGHFPYRDWCPDCVEGFGRAWAHHGVK